MKDLGARAFNYGYPAPVLIVATYNDDGSVNTMNLHECTRTNAGQLALCIGEGKKTHENIAKRRAFTLTVADKSFMAEADYFGLMSGYKVPDKFSRTGLTATKSKNVDAPIIEGSKIVIECELVECVRSESFSCVLANVVNILADESILNERGKIDSSKIGMLIYDSFGSKYFTLGKEIGQAFGAGKKFLH